MPFFASPEILKRRADTGLIIAFLMFLWLPAADTFLHLDDAPSSNENRTLAAFPTFHRTLAGTREYLAGIETYFNDHFGFRRQLVRWEHRWKWGIFRDMRASNVLVGKSDWLFYSGGRMIDDLHGKQPFRDSELEAWRALLTGRRDWLAQRGIRYLLVVPPDKHSIYPEYLPDWLAPSSRKPCRLDQFFSYMRTHSDLAILDLRDSLLKAKDGGRSYKKTDTHWNDRAAFEAYRRMVEALSAIGLPGTPMDRASMQEKIMDAPSGDLALMVGQQERLTEKENPFLTPKTPLPSVKYRLDASLIPKKWVTGTEPCVWENDLEKGSIVMFRDSFANAMAPYFPYSYRRTVLVWQQNWDKAFIEREKPDVVVDEILERFLIVRDPLDLKKADEQPEAQIIADR